MRIRLKKVYAKTMRYMMQIDNMKQVKIKEKSEII